MLPVTFKTELTDHTVITMTGYPTMTPGLVVNAVVTKCGDDCGWAVTHLRSGLAFPFCWGSPEAAIDYADMIADVADWRIGVEEIKPLLEQIRQPVFNIGYDSGGRLHRIETYRVTAHIDNGVVA